MKYRQLTPEERYIISHLRRQGFSKAQIVRNENRHGCYRPSKTQEKTNGQRKRSRRNSQFSADDWLLVSTCIGKPMEPGAGIRMAGQRGDAEDFSRDDLSIHPG